jgi:ElaB/YqjD/DUF883 family membrane-anchored ribosome-binding protein
MKTKAISPKEQLASDIRAVIADSEELLNATAGQAGEKINAARARAEESISAIKGRIEEIEQVVVDKAKAAAKATDTYVHENPWPAIGIAAGVGFLLGLLARRR